LLLFLQKKKAGSFQRFVRVRPGTSQWFCESAKHTAMKLSARAMRRANLSRLEAKTGHRQWINHNSVNFLHGIAT